MSREPSRIREIAIAALLGACVALVAAAWLAREGPLGVGPGGETGTTAQLGGAPLPVEASSSLEALQQALDDESIARETLATEVAMMRTVLDQLLQAGGSRAGGASLAAGEPRSNTASPIGGPTEQGVFDLAALVAAGIAQARADEVREAWEQKELARLELADRATREGWAFSRRHRKEAAALEAALEDELGEARYDELLYATAQPNRVIVRDVLGASAAARAGFRAGDHVLRYGTERIFTPKDLRNATTGGQRDETVRVDIEREGRRLGLSIGRGPMGVLLRSESVRPASTRP